MTILNALRFDAHAGAMVTDEESWHLRRRKTRFSVNLFPFGADATGVDLAYGGVGDPRYHREVIHRARQALEADPPASVEEAGNRFLDAMHVCTRRLVDDRLRFLFGFDGDDLNRGSFQRGDETFEIKNKEILKRAREIVEGKEKPAGRDLSPPNQAALIGSDPDGGFQMFCLKESDGVLSFNAGGFESLGPGRYAAGMRLSGALGEKTLAERRNGFPRGEGMVLLVESILDAGEHFGMVGGRTHILTLDDRRRKGSRIRLLEPDRGWLTAETVKGHRGGFLSRRETVDLVEALVFEKLPLEKGEKQLFEAASDGESLDLYLRGYKVAKKKTGRPAGGPGRRGAKK
ncbi:MAG: hypothetical protein ACYS47_19225 [Planctomycetota bacterium]|jgi:hypothetical protein